MKRLRRRTEDVLFEKGLRWQIGLMALVLFLALVMGVAWYGRYPVFFEEGFAELGRLCGLSYKEFAEANLHAPVAQFHIDYHQPLVLDEEFTVSVSLVWCEGARLNTEYTVSKEDGSIAATAYAVQMFVDAESGETCLTSPELIERCRRRWRAGELSWLE